MTPRPAPRLALARPAGHPLVAAAARAGWEAVPRAFTRMEATGLPAPRPVQAVQAVLVLSPTGARCAARLLPPGTRCLVQGPGTAEALGRVDLQVEAAAEGRAESLWNLLRACFPGGGDFLLVRGARSGERLEALASGGPWHLHPWTTHREAAATPFPDLVGLSAVLALSPFQAELLAPRTRDLLRFAWGERAAEAFARCGAPATGACPPDPAALQDLLARHLPQEELPC